MFTVNGWAFLALLVLAALIYKILELICFSIVVSIAAKHNCLNQIANADIKTIKKTVDKAKKKEEK
jgi:hypothetical protein